MERQSAGRVVAMKGGVFFFGKALIQLKERDVVCLESGRER